MQKSVFTMTRILALTGLAMLIVGVGVVLPRAEASAGAPIVGLIAPNKGPAYGGTAVEIRGERLQNASAVLFGDARAEFYRIESDGFIIALSPPQRAGTSAHVRVVTNHGTSEETVGDRFTYEVGGWRKAAPMSECASSSAASSCGARLGHSSTVLPDGRVLVTGGSKAGPTSGDTDNELDSVQIYDPRTEGWKRAAPLPVVEATFGGSISGRVGHTANLLLDGTVFVTGGRDGQAHDSAVVFQPTSDTWQVVTDRMTTQRADHTATLLAGAACTSTVSCGKVLLVGGASALAPSTELYDPSTQSFAALAEMAVPRSRHTATLLPDGKVLVVGGTGLDLGSLAALSTAELYDPAAKLWIPAGSMRTSRQGHTATLLSSGKVLVSGGQGSQGGAFDSTELYDVQTGIWSEGPPMDAARANHTATALPDGTVIAAGGKQLQFIPSGTISSAEVYDPAAEAWRPGPDMNEARHSHGAVALADGRVLVTGGTGPLAGEPNAIASVELLYRTTPPPPPVPKVTGVTPSSGPNRGGIEVAIEGTDLFAERTVVRFGEVQAIARRFESSSRVVATSPPHPPGKEVDVTVTTHGGTSAVTAVTKFSYDHDGAWIPTGALDACLPASASCAARAGHTATRLADGTVLIAGGASTRSGERSFSPLNAAEIYDPTTKTWTPTGSLVDARFGHTATLLAGAGCSGDQRAEWCGRVLIAGGRGTDGALATAELYDPRSRKWRSCLPAEARSDCPAPMSTPRKGHAATLLHDGNVLVAGGAGNSAERFDPESGTWTRTGQDMKAARTDATATLLSDSRVFVVGGGSSSSEFYDPASDTWNLAPGVLHLERSGHTATVLKNGTVLVAGGRPEGGGATSTAELYLPVEGRWERTGSMTLARSGHAAAKLLTDEVLVSGAGTAELYDSATGTWARTGSPARQLPPEEGEPVFHTATLLDDGTVLATGGLERVTNTGTYLPLAVAEIFDRTSAGPGPFVSEVEPRFGSVEGGNAVEVTGTALSALVGVFFGGERADVQFGTDNRIVVLAPPHEAGSVDLAVVTRVGRAHAGSYRYSNRAGAWNPTGDLINGRYATTSTLLDGPECRSEGAPSYCGKVLAAGGTSSFRPGSGDEAHATAEMYDPKAGSWTATGSLAVARYGHTATLLANGRVLVVGGASGGGGLGEVKAEVFDAETGTWSDAGSLATGRFAHTATLLDGPSCRSSSRPAYCGKVLVAGGTTTYSGRPALASAELFDPTLGTATELPMPAGAWGGTGDLAIPRGDHTATLLPNGKVLVVGGGTKATSESGATSYPPTDTAEIYDPASGRWSRTEGLAIPRLSHSATLLDRGVCGEHCGKVLVVGGILGGYDTGPGSANPRPVFLASVELFDPATGTWTAGPGLERARGGHGVALLPDGTVMVAGGGMSFDVHTDTYQPVSSSERYDAVAGRWTFAGDMRSSRGVPTATVLDGPACRTRTPARYCGAVLAAGGAGPADGVSAGDAPPPRRSAELFTPTAKIESITPSRGPAAGGTKVVIRGSNFSSVSAVLFGGVPAASFEMESPNLVTAMTPPQRGGKVEVEALTDGGTSSDGSAGSMFTFIDTPGGVGDLRAVPLSETQIQLSFTAPDDGSTAAPATVYVVKQSDEQITDGSFAHATSLCGGRCEVRPGSSVVLTVDHLAPGSTYHYRVRALNEYDVPGPLSNTAEAKTFKGAAQLRCEERISPVPGEVLYPGGSYSLVGLPDGTILGSDSPLYSWLNLGADGQYTVQPASTSLAGGRGYWAWSACDRLVKVGGPGKTSLLMPLDAYHASIVGNPSGTGVATVRGHDFTARWSPGANDGDGGYTVSGYREPQLLRVGEGIWAFSYLRTAIQIQADG